MDVVWKKYRKVQLTEMRDYVPGEDLEAQGITINPKDVPPVLGGKIARNPLKIDDQWYVNPVFFCENYTEA